MIDRTPYLCPECGLVTECWCGGCHGCDDFPEDYWPEDEAGDGST